MVPFIVYWGIIFVCIAWAALSLFFAVFYLSRKENGNLWVFSFLNVIAAIVLAVMMKIYHTWGWGITQYSSLIYLVLGVLLVTAVLEAVLGREPKEAKTV